MEVTSVEEIREQAGQYFGNGFHCAEAVVKTVLDSLGEDGAAAAGHATAFGGGFGKTGQEACGALSGALIAVGHFFGRRHPGPDWDRAAKLGAQLRQAFVETHGASQCQVLCGGIGEADQMKKCRIIVREVAGNLYETLVQSGAGCLRE